MNKKTLKNLVAILAITLSPLAIAVDQSQSHSADALDSSMQFTIGTTIVAQSQLKLCNSADNDQSCAEKATLSIPLDSNNAGSGDFDVVYFTNNTSGYDLSVASANSFRLIHDQMAGAVYPLSGCNAISARYRLKFGESASDVLGMETSGADEAANCGNTVEHASAMVNLDDSSVSTPARTTAAGSPVAAAKADGSLDVPVVIEVVAGELASGDFIDTLTFTLTDK
jgi:hypothetical protein